jgi:hypothetical protein
MSSTVILVTLVLALTGTVIAYLWPRPEIRFEKLFIASFGALLGSLLGRVASDPRWLGHLLYVTGGAFALSAIDWMVRSRHGRSGNKGS